MTNNEYLHVGVDFVDEKNERLTTVCLVRDGKSVASAFLNDGRIYRDLCVDSVNRAQFLKDAQELFENSIPVTFRKSC